MARYYTGDKDESVAPPLAFNQGRENTDAAKDTEVVLNRHIEGGAAGDTVKVSADRAVWLIAQGYATRPQDFVDQYADSRRPATPPEEPTEPEPEPEPEPDPEEGEGEGAA